MTVGAGRVGEGGASAGFLFDVDRCTGCRACELACATENDLGWERSWRRVVTVNERRLPGVPTFHLSVACNHCDDAPCVTECPARALRRDAATGAVLVDGEACIGCGYCGWVCPFDAPRFDGPGGVMSKCTLCHHRLTAGRGPACAEACPTGALGYGALLGATSVPGFPETPVGPRVRFAPRRAGERGSPSSLGAERGAIAGAAMPPEATDRTVAERRRRIDLRSEWPLWLFTTLVAFLAGWVGAWALADLVGTAVPFRPVAFVAALAAAAAVSTLHLGRKARAWRALLNPLRSRLSREILAFGAFAGAGVAAAVRGGPGAGVAGVLAAFLGVGVLVAVDRVYDPVRPSSGRPIHSADTVLTGPTVAAALLGSAPAFVVLAVVKAVLYVRSGAVDRGPGRAALRLGLGLGLPAALLAWPTAPVTPWAAPAAVAALLVGELTDRARFYQELRAPAVGEVGP